MSTESRTHYMSGENIQASIRLSEAEVQQISVEFYGWRIRHHGIGLARFDASYKRVIEFLSYLARGGYFHQLRLSLGVAKCSAIFHSKEVARFFAANASAFTQLPDVNEFQALATPLHDPRMNNVQQVILYIDGFIVKIQRPGHAGGAFLWAPWQVL